MAAFLAVAWAVSRPDTSVLPTGFVFAALLGGGALLLGLAAGGLDETLRRASRAALLVLTATWLRAAAGAGRAAEVGRRLLTKARRVPVDARGGVVLDSLGSERRLVAGARALAVSLRDVPYRPLPFLDAVLAWVVSEWGRREPDTAPPAPLVLRARGARRGAGGLGGHAHARAGGLAEQRS